MTDRSKPASKVPHPLAPLSRRERQIMDVIYRKGRAAAADVHAALPDAPTYTTVRGLLRVLVDKGHLRHLQEGRRYVYVPSTPPRQAGTLSIAHVVRTFFSGSPTDAMAALIDSGEVPVSDAELNRLATLVAEERKHGKKKGRR